jgi:Polyketide cyclase / dehydrase and lipid transport
MASIIREVNINVGADAAWAAIRDVGAVHEKLAPGIVTHATVNAGMRHVVFANGLELDEWIIGIDEAARRMSYTVQNRAKHHQASMQVLPLGDRQCRFVWITDVLPDDAASRFASVMDQALPVIVQTLERNAPQI